MSSILSIVTGMMGFFSFCFIILKERSISGANFNPNPAIKISVIHIETAMAPHSGPMQTHITMPLKVRIRLYNDGNRTSFVSEIRARLDGITPQEDELPPTVALKPFDMPLDIHPLNLSAVANYNDTYLLDDKEISIDIDKSRTVNLDCSLNFINMSSKGVRAKLSLGVIYYDYQGKYTIRSVYGGKILIVGPGRHFGLQRHIPYRDIQIVSWRSFWEWLRSWSLARRRKERA